MNKGTRLNILFISQLYPLSEESKNSFALHNFVKEWSKDHNVQVIRPYLGYEEEKNPKRNQIMIDGIKVDVVYPIWIPVMKICVINQRKIISLISKKPDVIVCHLYNSYLPFAFLKSHFEIPFIIGVHNSDIKLGNLFFHRLRIKNAIKNADGIVFRSKLIKKKIDAFIDLLNKNTFVANSGLSVEELKLVERQIKENRKRGTPIKILSACWLINRKQIDSVIKVLSRINLETKINWTYTIIGEGSEESRLIELVKMYDLESKITFKGRVSKKEVFNSMKTHDIYIMPSTNETFGLAYLEAMASGCIVIGAKGWGIDGIIQNGINGFLCDPKSIQDIYSKLYKSITLSDVEFNDIKRSSMSTVSNLSNKKIAADYLDFFYLLNNNINTKVM
ncbi:MAG: glycosyltransferase family 4 protein [Bacteroidetes bacterium]|nr:glycosyltransferase family 4 protein [Bacteroidota bacterium]